MWPILGAILYLLAWSTLWGIALAIGAAVLFVYATQWLYRRVFPKRQPAPPPPDHLPADVADDPWFQKQADLAGMDHAPQLTWQILAENTIRNAARKSSPNNPRKRDSRGRFVR